MKRLLILAGCGLFVWAGIVARGQEKKGQDSKGPQRQTLDINQASAEDFAKLPGIGPELARRIVAYRKKHGPFRRLEDLIAIRGMGAKKWRAIRPFLALADKRKNRERARHSL